MIMSSVIAYSLKLPLHNARTGNSGVPKFPQGLS
jgi:hypothetical protein